MTNKELAEKVHTIVHKELLNGNVSTGILVIEQALNEVYERGIDDALNAPLGYCNQIKKEYYKRGEEQMRERCALVCEKSVVPNMKENFLECTKDPHQLAEAIRSLPLTEQEENRNGKY